MGILELLLVMQPPQANNDSTNSKSKLPTNQPTGHHPHYHLCTQFNSPTWWMRISSGLSCLQEERDIHVYCTDS